MALTITTINIKDSIHTFRTTINTNFSAVKDEIDLISNVVDAANSNVTASNMTIEIGERATSVEVLTVEGSANVAGNMNISGTLTLSNTTITSGNSLSLNSGNLNVNGANSNVNIEGTVYFDGVKVDKDFGDTAIDGSLETNYVSVTSNVGLLDVSGKHAMILDFSNYSAVVDVGNLNDVTDIELQQGSYQGQELTLVLNTSASSGAPHRIVDANVDTLSGGQFISTSNDNAIVKLQYWGTGWKIISLYGASVV
jgi:hypothetical protein